jgi:Putative restriction endonuclease
MTHRFRDSISTPGADRRSHMQSLGLVTLSGGRYEIRRPDGQPVPFESYDAVPDERWIWELVDGRVLVSPPPTARQELATRQLHWELAATAPASTCVVARPARVRVDAADSVLVPDVMVIDCAQLGRRYVDPLLVADIRSPPATASEAELRRRLFALAGVPSYWLAATSPQPSLTALALGVDGCYIEVATAVGDQPLEVSRPFPVRVVPKSLITG